jgi:GxxExxY protein
MLHEEITDQIIKAYFKVYNTLGFGFLENVYENALTIEMEAMGLSCEKQRKIKVHYESHLVGIYYADVCVNDKVILELKATERLSLAHEAQLINYLKATDVEIGLLLNFGKQAEFKRKIFTNQFK